MRSIALLTSRNLRVFFRDRAGVFFSLLSALILISLYALFLGGLQVDSLKAWFPRASDANVRWFVNSWVFAGITMITTLTTAIAALGVFVDDNVTGRFRDFIVSPVRRSHLILGYMIAGFVVSIVMTTVIIVIGQLYLLSQGDAPLTLANLGEMFGAVALSSAAFSALAAFAVTFLKSTGAFTALSTVVGSLIGFFSGAYVPAGTLPPSVADGINVLPFAHAAMLIRRPYTEQALTALIGGQDEVAEKVRSFYGMSASVGDFAVTGGFAILALVIVGVMFAGLGAWRLSRTIR
jgi:multidrug/hemolysin transport system permease protein